MRKTFRIKFILLIGAVSLALPFFTFAASYSYGQQDNFYVNSSYDKAEREEISATIRYVSSRAYFYIEDKWWDDLTIQEKGEINSTLKNLAQEFDNKIYPTLTSVYGSEWKPGIDNDYRVTVLFEQMRKQAAGYFREVDEYRKIQAPNSNEREMVYLSVRSLGSKNVGAFLSHEFTHLITFNQKNRRIGQEEDVWLNELRAEYSPTFLGYDKDYEDSNLETRINYFIANPTDSLTEWKGETRDYGVINNFAQYLVEHYGIGILSRSMASPYVGIASLNYALTQEGIDKDLSQIFADWAVAVALNDCSLEKEYCFSEEPLSYLRIAPSLIYLPSTQETNLSLVYAVKEWAGHWYKIIGGGKGLKVEFKSLSNKDFIIPYLVQRDGKIESVKFLTLDKGHKGTIELPYFSENRQALVIIPLITEKTADFSDNEPFWRFSLNISTFENGQTQEEQENQQREDSGQSDNGTDEGGNKPISEMTIEELKAKIAEIQQLILQLQTELQRLLEEQFSCEQINSNLRYGMTNNPEVRCLQEFLKNQGEDIYPEGLITGNFYSLTRQAVIRFQEKYSDEILAPLGLSKGTGFVGAKTRTKINQLLNS